MKKECQHVDLYHLEKPGSFITGCGSCGLYEKSEISFNESDRIFNKRFPKDSRDEYRRGVEDATKPFDYGPLTASRPDTYLLNQKLEERRKQLLSKKVTKWVSIFRKTSMEGGLSGMIYDTKEEAEHFCSIYKSFVGAYPIEIKEES